MTYFGSYLRLAVFVAGCGGTGLSSPAGERGNVTPAPLSTPGSGAVETDRGERVSGRDAREAIDQGIVRSLQAIVPPLTIGAIECPDTMQAGSAGADRCTISIDDHPFEVVVRIDSTSHTVTAQLQAAFVNVAELEAIGAEAARRQGRPETKIDCGLPKLRLMAVGDAVRCTASRASWSHDWVLKVVNAEGGILIPHGFPSSENAAPDPAIARLEPVLKRASRIVDGADLEAVLRSYALPDMDLGSLHCPAKVDLSDGHHDWCTGQAMGKTMRLRVDVHDGAWRVVPEQAILIMDRLERAAAENGAELARTRGVPGVVVQVSCGTPRVVVVDYPAKYTCDATLPSGKHRPVTMFLDAPGALPIYFWGDPKDAKR